MKKVGHDYAKIFRENIQRLHSEPWRLKLVNPGEVLEQAQFLRSIFKDDPTERGRIIHQSLCVLIGFQFHEARMALGKKDAYTLFSVGIEIGMQWAALQTLLGQAVSDGRPKDPESLRHRITSISGWEKMPPSELAKLVATKTSNLDTIKAEIRKQKRDRKKASK